ncbi:TlpA family protein disulfide reductase [Sphingomonas sp. 28-63-12]|uniref:TlpA family protein disulfide reductase n=1 Tax=Sphingomonas sp. 28-63-12 TaxID=1970434 RepID=UPI0035A8C25D
MPDEVKSAPRAKPATTGAMGVLDRSHKGEAASTLQFLDPAGTPVTLASFAGKPVLLNLWATWCAPCVAEMPTLDALAVREGGTLTIVPVSQDLEGAAKVDPFFKNAQFKALKPYRDPQAALSIAFQANLPTTILYDSTGHEVWRMLGGVDWTGPQAAALLAEAK